MERRPRLREPDSESHSASSRSDFASAVTAISAAFGDPTRRDIYLYAHSCAEGVTATETAEHFELHPNVARHHLDKLASGGYVEVGTAAEHLIYPASSVCGDEADDAADRKADKRPRQGDEDRRRTAVEESAEDVSSREVEAEKMLARRLRKG